MTRLELNTVKINIATNMYRTFSSLRNTVPHALAEFVDNALQSYKDNKDALYAIEPNYKLTVNIDIEWDLESSRANKIIISDNAAGISESKYVNAFMPAKVPEDNSGLNEFGMGLKTAALWLGENWIAKTKALGENIERKLTFNLNEVTVNELDELPIETIAKKKNDHYTIVEISDLTDNAPTKRSLDKIKSYIASIYRKSLHQKEMRIIVCGDELKFDEYPILIAPPVKRQSSEPVEWKKNIDFSFGKYKAKGFIAILRDIDSTKNGFVLLRRGRVIVGAETDGRYFPKALSGSVGTFRYKRLFGEIELEGFNVSFSKNDIQDRENLEALMEALRDQIRTPEFDIFKQAEDYRLNESQRVVNKLVKKHNNKIKKAALITINTQTKKQEPPAPQLFPDDEPEKASQTQPEIILGETIDEYRIDGKKYKLNVEFVNKGNELFWSDVSHKDDGVIVCKINTDHVFFRHFGSPTDSVIAIIKTIAISKFAANTSCNRTANEMLDLFNEFIKQTRV